MKKVSNIYSDTKSLKTLYDAYAPSIYKFVYSILRSSVEAQEVTQMVFIKIWELRESLVMDKGIKHYLFTIAKNSSYDILRRKYKERVLLEQLQYGIDNVSSGVVDNEMIYKEMSEKLSKLIGQLPAQRRKIFIYNRFEGLTYKEIAKTLNISENTVDTQMRRTLKFLRKNLIDEISIIIITILIS